MIGRHTGMAMVALAIVCLVALSGCKPSVQIDFQPSAPATSYDEVERQAASADLGSASRITVSDAPEARSRALVWLRRQGAEGDRAASILTTGFPVRTAAVPVLVHIAEIEDVRALVVVEAFGEASGSLDHRRLWVFDYDTGVLIRSSSYR